MQVKAEITLLFGSAIPEFVIILSAITKTALHIAILDKTEIIIDNSPYYFLLLYKSVAFLFRGMFWTDIALKYPDRTFARPKESI